MGFSALDNSATCGVFLHESTMFRLAGAGNARHRHSIRADSLITVNRGPTMTGPRLVLVTQPLVRVQLFGAMNARSYQGESVLPRGLRARAIFVHMLLSRDDVIPRRRYDALLWSQRGEKQAGESGRQSVRELGLALGRVQPKILEVNRDTIRIDRTRVWIEGLSQRATGETPDAIGFNPATFLETLLGLDPNFDAWISDMRAGLQVRGAVAVPSQTMPAPMTPAPMTPAAITPAPLALSLKSRPTTKRAPRVDVMPFVAFGGDDGNAHMAPALSHELATGLARFRWISVRLLHAPATTPDFRREGPDYRLQGHLAHAATGGRLTVRLTDSHNGDEIVWAHGETIDGPLRPAFVADIAERIVGRLDPEILAIETRKVTSGPLVADDAYGLLLRAIPKLYTFERGGWEESTALLQRAIDIEPGFGRAQAFLALCGVTGLAQGWVKAGPEAVAHIDALAEAARNNDTNDSLGIALSAHIRTFLHHDFDGAKALYAKALDANPNCGFTWAYSCLTYAYTCDSREASRRYNRAAALFAEHPFAPILAAFKCVVLFCSRDWNGTIAASRRLLATHPAIANARKLLIGALCFAGRYAEARAEHVVLMAQEPWFTWTRHVETYPFARLVDRENLFLALEAADILPPLRAGALRSRDQPETESGVGAEP